MLMFFKCDVCKKIFAFDSSKKIVYKCCDNILIKESPQVYIAFSPSFSDRVLKDVMLKRFKIGGIAEIIYKNNKYNIISLDNEKLSVSPYINKIVKYGNKIVVGESEQAIVDFVSRFFKLKKSNNYTLHKSFDVVEKDKIFIKII